MEKLYGNELDRKSLSIQKLTARKKPKNNIIPKKFRKLKLQKSKRGEKRNIFEQAKDTKKGVPTFQCLTPPLNISNGKAMGQGIV